MPFSFTQIEKSKSRIIVIAFCFLFFLYFAAIWGITFLIHNYPAFDAFMSGKNIPWEGMGLFKNLSILIVSLIIASLHWLFIVVGLKERLIRILKAQPLDLNDPVQRMFQNIIEELRVATGDKILIEGMVIPSLALNACALSGGESASIVALTKGLLHKLNRPQLEAVVAHEAGHILSGDGEGTTLISSMFETFGAALRAGRLVVEGLFEGDGSRQNTYGWHPTYYGGRWRSGSHTGSGSKGPDSGLSSKAVHLVIFIILIAVIMWVVHILSLLMRMFISREREYRADAVAARLTRNPMALAQALYIIVNRRHSLLDAADSLETMFIVNPGLSNLDNEDGLFPDLFSTHPPVKNRIKVLLSMAHGTEEDLAKALQTIQLKEKDDEDRQINTRQATVAKVEKNEQNVTGICPACQGPLESVDYEHANILKCRQCEGVLVAENDIVSILHRKQHVFDDRIKNMAAALKEERALGPYEPIISKESDRIYRCDQCKHLDTKLRKCLFNRFYHVEIDKCMTCGLTWFDKDELELMQCLYEMWEAENRKR